VSALADALASATTPQDIYDAALTGIQTALGVERASVLLFDADGVMRFKAWRGLSAEYRQVVEGHTPWQPGQPTPAPIVVRDVASSSELERYRPAFDSEGIRALAFIPLASRGRTIGKFMLYWREPHQPSMSALDAALVIGALVGLAVERARQNAEMCKRAQRSAFLSEASARLSSLDYEKNLEAIAQLIVPRFADWCVVDLFEGGELRRLAVAHADPAKVEFARELHRRYPPRRDEPGGLWNVLTSGQPRLYQRIDDEMLQHAARDAEHLSILRDVGLRSAMLVPLCRGEQTLGVLSLVLAGSERYYDNEDLEFAQELACRASYAIENARLYRQAQDANRAKDEFLAALSHELRTPLNAILGWASILRARPDGQMERGLDVIYRNAKVQAQLVDDLLDASRIVSGRMSIDLKDVPLRPIVEAAVETIVPQAVDKDIDFMTTLPDAHVMIRGDAARLQQVFWNILSNAVKFTPRGGRIEVSTSATPSEVAVHVTDTGAGIRHEALPFIFDRFRQADASSTRSYRGLGLGLTLSRQLTEMHGGRVGATSAGPGHGSTFTVALPLVEPAVPKPVSPTPVPQDALAGLRILAVDDDPDSLDVLTSILRLHSATVFGAASAVEALELLQREGPDLIISDIAMPEHDGYWLMQQLQRIAHEGGRSVPCIALTAFANEAARRRALTTGFAAHLTKPLNPDELVRAIRPLIH
jgi:signal transduction histidine kinase/CheY-like chemotaxis protein